MCNATRNTGLVALALALACLAIPARAGQDDIQVDVEDGRISMSAEAVSLVKLLDTLDRAVGTESSVADHLQNRNMSVRFQNLDFNDAVRKIFEGQSLDYIVVGQERIMVTAESGVTPPGGGTLTRTASRSSGTPAPTPRETINAPAANPFRLQPNVQPAGQPVQTPFGTIFQGGNPAAGRGGAPAAPENTPAQPSSLFGNTNPNPFNNPAPDPAPQAPQPRGPIPGQPIPVQPRQ